jgi:hypothetical protein
MHIRAIHRSILKAKRKRALKKKRAFKPPKKVAYLLDQFTFPDIKWEKAKTDSFLKYHWDHYSDLAYQRKKIEENLVGCLNEGCITHFQFDHWQRTVKHQYSLHPLSSIGSIKDIGGRFNIGDIKGDTFPIFAGLYIACDKDTALQETLLNQDLNAKGKLSPIELALTNPLSITIVSVSGSLDKVFDLRAHGNLQKFVDLIKRFKFSEAIKESARFLGIQQPRVVEQTKELYKTLMEKDWRQFPMQWDIPSNSQIFGHLVYISEIEGILYKSTFTNKDCLVIFPANFKNTSSYVKIDNAPPPEMVHKVINAETWPSFVNEATEI